MFRLITLFIASNMALLTMIHSVSTYFNDISEDLPSVYDTWTGPNLHLIMSDNGTPDDFGDDWVIDWEDNREVINIILDK